MVIPKKRRRTCGHGSSPTSPRHLASSLDTGRARTNEGLSMTVWESEDAAREAAERITRNMPQTVELQDYEIREVVANA